MSKLILPDGAIFEVDESPAPVAKSAAKPAIPSTREITRQVIKDLQSTPEGRATLAGLAKSARADQERRNAAEVLLKQAREWRQKATDGRVNGTDHEVRALYVRKAQAAEAEAVRLGQPVAASAVDEDKARAFDAEAQRCETKATDTSLNLALRAYYRDKARDHRDSAAALRGLPIEGEAASQPVNRSVSINLPR